MNDETSNLLTISASGSAPATSGTTTSAEPSFLHVVFPETELALTGKLIEHVFNGHFLNVITHRTPIIISPRNAGYEVNTTAQNTKEQVMRAYHTVDIPAEWQQANFKEQMKEQVERALHRVLDDDVVVFTGGRDYNPILLGNPRHSRTQTHSIFDIRDVVESYMLLAAIAHGKTLHATCRGYQVVTGNMMGIFADDPVPIHQHLPELLAQHTQRKEEDLAHHGGGELAGSLDQHMRSNQAEYLTVVHSYNEAELPHPDGGKYALFKPANSSHKINVEKPGLWRDTLSLIQPISPARVSVSDSQSCVTNATAHHQGWAITSDAEKERLETALSQAGGEITAYSADPRDGDVRIVEGVQFSLPITQEVIDKLQQRCKKLNELLGLDIKLPLPDLEKQPHLRVDIPHAVQPHPEVNIARGEALVGPALLIAFARAKKQAQLEGKDIGGYESWRETVADLRALPEVALALQQNKSRPMQR